MSLLRTSRVLSNYGRSIMRTSTVAHQQRRGYAMSLTFACPGDAFYKEADVKQVDIPGYYSSFGILENHVPLITVMKPGVLTVTEKDDRKNSYFVSSGSVTINEDSSVQILAEEAVPLESLDKNAIADGLTEANKWLHDAKDDKEKAEAQVMIDAYTAMAASA